MHDTAGSSARHDKVQVRHLQHSVSNSVECCRDFAGSFSAEHGVGPHNLAYYERYSAPEARTVCSVLGALFDPSTRLGTFRLG